MTLEMYRSKEHMAKIIEVCKLTPDTKHWLPTQERQFLPAPEDVPDNLVIRLSRSKIDGPSSKAWSHESGVTTETGAVLPSAYSKAANAETAELAGTKTYKKCWYMVNINARI
jgi:hypothetical protein